MATTNPKSEPSMEEILASIRRIISEDDEGPRKPKEEPLELSLPVAPPPAPPPARAVAPAPAPMAADDLMVFDEEPPTPPPPLVQARRVEPKPAPAPAPEPMMMEDSVDSIVGEPAVAAAAGAFTKLAGTLRISNAPGQTLEGIVRELLRPMMKEWLDAHLPAIVEAKVEAELERISRLSR